VAAGPREPAWLGSWRSNATPGFVCTEVRTDTAPDFPDTALFPAATLRRYGVQELVHTRWRDTLRDDAPELLFCCARLPDELHAYGLYHAAADGVDQAALRGGPAKRLPDALVIYKDRWVAWTEPEAPDGPHLVNYEELFGKLCSALPAARWQLPDAVMRLAALDPSPAAVTFVPDGFLKAAAIGPVITAEFPTGDGRAELFQALPSQHSHGAVCMDALRNAWARQGLTVTAVAHAGETRLFAPDTPDGPVYAVLTDSGLCGVRGLAHLSDARALVARWLNQ
jgi:hypothetical protein